MDERDDLLLSEEDTKQNQIRTPPFNRERRKHPTTTPALLPVNSPSPTNSIQNKSLGLEAHALVGLSIASSTAYVLRSIFALFMEFRNGQVPHANLLQSAVFYCLGCWWLDQAATSRRRTDWVGVFGALLVVTFAVSLAWDTPWLFECVYALATIVWYAPVVDDYYMSYNNRVYFMASGQVCNLLASLLARKMGEHALDMDLPNEFTILLIVVSLILFAMAQNLIQGSSRRLFDPQALLFLPKLKDRDDSSYGKRNLELMDAMRTLASSKSFRTWILTTVPFKALVALMESALYHTSTEFQWHWMLSKTQPLKLIAVAAMYIPIQRFGYHRAFKFVFFVVSMISILSMAARYSVLSKKDLTPVVFSLLLLRSVFAASFQLAMADMALEIQLNYFKMERFDEPSVSAILIGSSAMLCKPFASLAVMIVKHFSFHDALLLVIAPIVCRLQLLVWRRYRLTPKRTEPMREKLRRLRKKAQRSGSGV